MSLIMSGHMGSMWPSTVMLQQNASTEQFALSQSDGWSQMIPKGSQYETLVTNPFGRAVFTS